MAVGARAATDVILPVLCLSKFCLSSDTMVAVGVLGAPTIATEEFP